MRLIIDISEYNAEYIRNTYRVPQDINMVIAEAIINGKQIPTPHGRLADLDKMINDFWDCDSMIIGNYELEKIEIVIEGSET